jgi:hypothetical protein
MSKIFYDHLIVLEEVRFHIDKVAKTSEEKEELWKLVDEIIHHRVLTAILEKLPEKHHNDFLKKFYAAPHDESLIAYLNEKINEDFESFIKGEVKTLSNELLQLVGGKAKK